MALDKILRILGDEQQLNAFQVDKRVDALNLLNDWLADPVIAGPDLQRLGVLWSLPTKEEEDTVPAVAATAGSAAQVVSTTKETVAALEKAYKICVDSINAEVEKDRRAEFDSLIDRLFKEVAPSLWPYLDQVLQGDLRLQCSSVDQKSYAMQEGLSEEDWQDLLNDLAGVLRLFTSRSAIELADLIKIQKESLALMQNMWGEICFKRTLEDELKRLEFECLDVNYAKGTFAWSESVPFSINPNTWQFENREIFAEKINAAKKRFENLKKLQTKLLRQQEQITELCNEIIVVGSTFYPKEDREENCWENDKFEGRVQTNVSRTAAQRKLVSLGFLEFVVGSGDKDIYVFPTKGTPEEWIESLQKELTKFQHDKMEYDFKKMEDQYFSTKVGRLFAPYRREVSAKLRAALGIDNPDNINPESVKQGKQLLQALFPALQTAYSELNNYLNDTFDDVKKKTPENRGVDLGKDLLFTDYAAAKQTLVQFGFVEQDPKPRLGGSTIKEYDIFNLALSQSVEFHPENLREDATQSAVVLSEFDKNFALLQARVAEVKAFFATERAWLLAQFGGNEQVLQRFFTYADPEKRGDGYLLRVFSDAGLLVPNAKHAYEICNDQNYENRKDRLKMTVRTALEIKIEAFQEDKARCITTFLDRLNALGYFEVLPDHEGLYQALLGDLIAYTGSQAREQEIYTQFVQRDSAGKIQNLPRDVAALSPIVDLLQVTDATKAALEKCFYHFIANDAHIAALRQAKGIDVQALFEEIKQIDVKLQAVTTQRHAQHSRAFDGEIKQLQDAKAALQKIAAGRYATRFEEAAAKNPPALVLSLPAGSDVEAEKKALNLYLLSQGFPELPDDTRCTVDGLGSAHSFANTLNAMLFVSRSTVNMTFAERAVFFEDLIAGRPDALKKNVFTLAMNATQKAHSAIAVPVEEPIQNIAQSSSELSLADALAALRQTRDRIERSKEMGYIARLKFRWNTGNWFSNLESTNATELLRNKENLMLALRRPLEDPIAKRLAADAALMGTPLTEWERLWPRWYTHQDFYTAEQMQILLPLASVGQALKALSHYHPQAKTWAGNKGKAIRLALMRTTIERAFAEHKTGENASRTQQDAIDFFFKERADLFPDLDTGLNFFSQLIDRTSHSGAFNYLYKALERNLFNKRPKQFIKLLMRTIVSRAPGSEADVDTLALFKEQLKAFPEAVLDLLNDPALSPRARQQVVNFLLEDHKKSGVLYSSVLDRMLAKCDDNPKIALLQLTAPEIFKVVTGAAPRRASSGAYQSGYFVKTSALQDYLINWVRQAVTTPEILVQIKRNNDQKGEIIECIIQALPFSYLAVLGEDINRFKVEHLQLNDEAQQGLTNVCNVIDATILSAKSAADNITAAVKDIGGLLQANKKELENFEKASFNRVQAALETAINNSKGVIGNAKQSHTRDSFSELIAATLLAKDKLIEKTNQLEKSDKSNLEKASELLREQIASLTHDPSAQVEWIKQYALQNSKYHNYELPFVLNVQTLVRLIQFDTRHYADLRTFALTDLALTSGVAKDLLGLLCRAKDRCVALFETNMTALKQELIARSSDIRTDIQHRSWADLQNEITNIVRLDSKRYSELLRWVVSENRLSGAVKQALKETLQKVAHGLFDENQEKSTALSRYNNLQAINRTVLEKSRNNDNEQELRVLLNDNEEYMISIFGKGISTDSAINRLKSIETERDTTVEIEEVTRRVNMVRDNALDKDYKQAKAEWLAECADAAVLYQDQLPIYSEDQLCASLAGNANIGFAFTESPLASETAATLSKLNKQARLVAAYQIQAQLIRAKGDIALEQQAWGCMSQMLVMLGRSEASLLDAASVQRDFPLLRNHLSQLERRGVDPQHIERETNLLNSVIGFVDYRQEAIRANNQLIAAFMGVGDNYPHFAVAPLPLAWEAFKTQQTEVKNFLDNFAKSAPPAGATEAEIRAFAEQKAILAKNLEIIQETEDTLHITLVEQRIQQLLNDYFKQPNQDILFFEDLFVAVQHYKTYMHFRAEPKPLGINPDVITQAKRVCFPVLCMRNKLGIRDFLTVKPESPATENTLYSAIDHIYRFLTSCVEPKIQDQINEGGADRLLATLCDQLESLTLEKVASLSDNSDVFVTEDERKELKQALEFIGNNYALVAENCQIFDLMLGQCKQYLEEIDASQNACAHIWPVLKRALNDAQGQTSNGFIELINAMGGKKLTPANQTAIANTVRTIMAVNRDPDANSVLIITKMYQAIQDSIGGTLRLTSAQLNKVADCCQAIKQEQDAEAEKLAQRQKDLCAQYTEDLKNSDEQLTKLEKSIDETGKKVNDHVKAKKFDEANSLLTALQTQLNAVKPQLDARKDWNASQQLVKDSVAEHSRRYTYLDDRIAELQKSVEAAADQKAKAENEMVALIAQEEQLKQDVTEHHTNCEFRLGFYGNNKNVIPEIEYKGLQERIASLLTQIDQLLEKYNKFASTENGALKDLVGSKQSQLTEHKERLKNMSSSLSLYQMRIGWSKRLTAQQRQLNTIRATLTEQGSATFDETRRATFTEQANIVLVEGNLLLAEMLRYRNDSLVNELYATVVNFMAETKGFIKDLATDTMVFKNRQWLFGSSSTTSAVRKYTSKGVAALVLESENLALDQANKIMSIKETFSKVNNAADEVNRWLKTAEVATKIDSVSQFHVIAEWDDSCDRILSLITRQLSRLQQESRTLNSVVINLNQLHRAALEAEKQTLSNKIQDLIELLEVMKTTADSKHKALCETKYSVSKPVDEREYALKQQQAVAGAIRSDNASRVARSSPVFTSIDELNKTGAAANYDNDSSDDELLRSSPKKSPQ